MYLLIGMLVLIILILIGINLKNRRQVKDICRQLSFLKNNDTNMIITSDVNHGSFRELTDELNEFLEKYRKDRRSFLEKEKMIAETYTNLSHDIRTPLTSLDGYVQLLEESENPTEQKKYLKIVHERINSLKEILEELFTFTKLKNESYSIELNTCCLNKIIKDTVFSYYDDWQELGISAEINITDEPLYIEGNVQALHRVLQNIIKNAIDHGENKIGILLEKRGDDAYIEIKNEVDDAEAIDTDRVFERFYKADMSRSKNSTGLGLSIARELVLRMNGDIYARLDGNMFCICVSFCKSSKQEKNKISGEKSMLY